MRSGCFTGCLAHARTLGKFQEGRKEGAVLPPNVGFCLGVKAHMMVELSDCGGEIDQTVEEDPAGTTLAAACLRGGAAAVLMC